MKGTPHFALLCIITNSLAPFWASKSDNGAKGLMVPTWNPMVGNASPKFELSLDVSFHCVLRSSHIQMKCITESYCTSVEDVTAV